MEPSGAAQVGIADGKLYQADLQELRQGLPPLTYTGEDTAAWLRDSLLTLRLEGTAAADVAVSGLSWQPRYVRPTLWTDPSQPRSAVEPLLPDSLAGGDEEGEGQAAAAALGFREVALDMEEDSADRLALARRPMAARQGTREFVRGRIGSMPFTPGGAAWDAGGNSAAAAAAEEAASGAWLAELERGQPELLKAVPPGMPRGLFGGWAADAAEAEAVAAAAEEVAALQAAEQQAAEAAEAAGARQQQQKVSLEDLFSGVWLLEDGGAGAEGAAAGGDEDWDAPPAEEEEEEEVAEVAAAAGAAAGPLPAAAAADPLLGLPSGDQLPGGVEGDAVAAVLGAEAAAADWARRTPAAAGGGGFATLGSRPIKRQRGDHEWALKGHIPGLAKQWERARAGLAKSWPFELDVFQKEAILHMEGGRSVFVAAHTSAGKTVAAEYAFALAARHCTRAVPNVMEFADWVGRTKQKHIYVTGTTKRPVPLQHSLYFSGQLFPICQADSYSAQGFRAAREAAKARAGPAPQTRAEAQRALPTGRGDGGGGGGRGGRGGRGGAQQQQQQRHGQRGSANAGAAAMAAANRQAAAQQGGGGGQMRSERSQWMSLIEMLRKSDLLPCVVFVFSKKRIEALADNLQARRWPWVWVSLDLSTASEKSEIHLFCEKALARLKGSDRELPQVLRVREMLKRGLGVHHAGEPPPLLRAAAPIAAAASAAAPPSAEIVEMLFCRGVIRVLFSTETFAMGVNAPARTVIFQSLRKHDGKSFRNLLPGEYTQMAGRAGRRGLDTVGTVVIACWDELPEEVEVKKMLTGSATRLESQFRLTYSMILNLLRVEDLKVEDMLKRSFAEEEMEAYCRLCMDVEALDARLQAEVMGTRAAQQALALGRVVLVRAGGGAGSGITELGVVCSEGPVDAGGGSTGSRGLDDFFGGSGGAAGAAGGAVGRGTSEDGGGGGGAASGRKYAVLYLHRPSPLDPAAPPPAGPAAADGSRQAAPAAATRPAAAAAAAGGPPGSGVPPGEPMLRLKKKDDDDDLLLMGRAAGGKKGGKKGGGGGGGGRQAAAATLGGGLGGGFGGGPGGRGARPAVALPHAGEVAGVAFRLAQVAAADVVGICKVKIRVDGDGVLAGEGAALAAGVTALARVGEDAAAAGADPPTLDPVADLKLNSIDLVGDLRLRAQLAAQQAAMRCHRDPLLPEMLAIARSERLLAARLGGVARQMSNASLAQLPEYHQRVKVLQRLGYLERDQAVTMKGRVACEVNSGDELVATEIIFSGLLAELEAEEAVALLSALEKTAGEPELTPRLEAARLDAVSLALRAGLVQQECGLQLTPEEFASSTLKWGLAEVVYEWARGTPFQQICGLTDVMEGSIVRAMVRLDETCRWVGVGLDVIFAASLYVA
ncbi:hypothetical protein CHLNCDRAFT_144334 [Chlorella variabilis]|uniref:Helicase C-terminal domain-containing protein n=1 Tax=Chlorella variabilis TaxID=554065 RepID=E1ZCF7_CHLVA|nr:hypothetical protein CHLNCDRAFT_144334 [Chlorella variabilis]EFN56807.1 hypothetical protein CHLNCDRAFT_144334 [Chlorella variabilis]|eukprot:XP_005848909.1 hypothetical protein CHLNCDRAFT_144334 [Chlorella variabilis]